MYIAYLFNLKGMLKHKMNCVLKNVATFALHGLIRIVFIPGLLEDRLNLLICCQYFEICNLISECV